MNQIFLITYVGGIVPFSNPSGILAFGEDSVQTINLTLLNNDTVEVRMCIHACICMFVCITYVCIYIYRIA